MRMFELESHRGDGIIFSIEDFDSPLNCAIKFKGIPFKIAFIPEEMSESYEDTELWKYFYSHITYGNVYFYKESKYKEYEDI